MYGYFHLENIYSVLKRKKTVYFYVHLYCLAFPLSSSWLLNSTQSKSLLTILMAKKEYDEIWNI